VDEERGYMRHNGSNSQQTRWEQLEALLGTKLPALPSAQDMAPWTDKSWVDDYVQQMLKKTMPTSGMRGIQGKSEVFETHHYVIVKLKLPHPNNPVVKVRTDQVVIEDNPNVNRQAVQLPCLIIPRLSRASYKNGILQIKLRKRKINKTYHDIFVRYL
jgi:HSP20 family molecular chaperone IbpA